MDAQNTSGLIQVNETEEVTLTLPVEFAAWLRDGYGLSARQVLTAFVHDLRGTVASNGSDERRLAEAWFDRVMWPERAQGRVYQASSGQWSWAISRDGEDLVSGAGHASEDDAWESMEENLEAYLSDEGLGHAP